MSVDAPPTAEALSSKVLRHAAAIRERTPAPSGGAITHADQLCHADADAICQLVEEHGRRLDREADRIARGAAERAADYIEDHLSAEGDGPSFGDGMREVLDELERLGLSDEHYGTGPLADACRRLRRASQQR